LSFNTQAISLWFKQYAFMPREKRMYTLLCEHSKPSHLNRAQALSSLWMQSDLCFLNETDSTNALLSFEVTIKPDFSDIHTFLNAFANRDEPVCSLCSTDCSSNVISFSEHCFSHVICCGVNMSSPCKFTFGSTDSITMSHPITEALPWDVLEKFHATFYWSPDLTPQSSLS
jgi:hypothetical protein